MYGWPPDTLKGDPMSETLAAPAPSSTDDPTDAPGTVLWYTRCPVPSPLGIAARLGWLEAEFQPLGLQVKSIIDSPVKAIRESHFSHHLAWSFRQGGNIPPLWARAQGAATRLVALTWTDEFQAVTARCAAPPTWPVAAWACRCAWANRSTFTAPPHSRACTRPWARPA